MIETRFDVPFIADLALREKQIQQNYRPPIAVHKWFARRPGTVFRGLVLSEFVDKPLRETFYESNSLPGRHVADPFMGGGTPLMEANRVGCDVIGFDINPMAYWIVRQEIEHLDLRKYRTVADRMRTELEAKVGHLYRTRCLHCGRADAAVKYFLWVKTATCAGCGANVRLFPGYLVSEDRRHPKNVFFCPHCDQLTETADRKAPGKCAHCGKPLRADGPALRGCCPCPSCAADVRFPVASGCPPRHALYAIEYHCTECLASHTGRFFKVPDDDDRRRLTEAETTWSSLRVSFAPEAEIPTGDETDRLHRWGYRRYREMFNPRQLLGLELSCQLIRAIRDTRVRNALATNLSDLLRYQNMLCRYDTMALKSLDIFSVHGFPVGLIQCESNLLGIPRRGGDGSVGSGGWFNIIEKFAKAKAYCDHPFEFRHNGAGKERVDIAHEWIGDEANGRGQVPSRTVSIACADASLQAIPSASLDAVFTDPPYFGNVQYAELMDFCYVWLRRLVGDTAELATDGFVHIDLEHVLPVAVARPISLVVLRSILGFTPPEWAYVTAQRTGVKIDQGAVRTLDRSVRLSPEKPLAVKGGVGERLRALVESACALLNEGVPEVGADRIHRLDKADTGGGQDAIRRLSAMGVPYAMLLYERFLGRPFAGHRDSVSEIVGDVVESAVEDVLSKAGVSYRKTKRAERIDGFDQAPDFIIPSEFNPQIIIEAKLTEDDGTARDKVTRIQHLGELSRSREAGVVPRFEVVACIAGRGFGVRREDMKKMLIATRGKVFTLKTMDRLVTCTRLHEFATTRRM
jgi:site-specific DNA-adenine methylase